MATLQQPALADAMARLERGDAVAAERLFRVVLEADADDARAVQGLGKALYDQRRFAEAEAMFRRAEWVDPEPALARYHRAPNPFDI